ncbi:hypothetical protein BDR22DRAFT_819219 [Usnea florida]
MCCTVLTRRFSQQDPSDPVSLRPLLSKDPVRRSEDIWDLIQRMINIAAFFENTGMKPKKVNIEVEPWPTRLHKKHGEPSAQEEFDRLKDCGSVGKHRFVQCVKKRIGPAMMCQKSGVLFLYECLKAKPDRRDLDQKVLYESATTSDF